MENIQVVFLFFAAVIASSSSSTGRFGGPCSKQDPNVDICLLHSFNSLAEYLKGGAPDFGIEEAEPIVIDELSIALGGGPDGYRASFKDIHATGASNMTITNVRSDLETHQFQLTLFGPHISARARYRSSGVLLLVRASGGGDYWGEYDGVKAKVYFRGSPYERDGRTFLKLEQLKLDFSVKDIQMGVENLHNGNAVLQAALNLFINTNAQELLKEMKPDLKRDLAEKMSRFLERILDTIPLDEWITD
ncbi:protein takeout isoform X2 [Plutella xylostella]|uniref:protein takeout isoform X1 n=1 Tax=Plutella xylostella TaxID=51655 RepID=UPI0005D09343|nr:protein takeout isoform X1 [Plutella xylostella]XP_048482076.1 protein takeout isoform X2 [Plutella xylostella]